MRVWNVDRLSAYHFVEDVDYDLVLAHEHSQLLVRKLQVQDWHGGRILHSSSTPLDPPTLEPFLGEFYGAAQIPVKHGLYDHRNRHLWGHIRPGEKNHSSLLPAPIRDRAEWSICRSTCLNTVGATFRDHMRMGCIAPEGDTSAGMRL